MNRKFNIGQKVLTDSEIEKHKDFDALFLNYQVAKQPFYRTSRFIIGTSAAAAAIAIIALVFSFLGNFFREIPDPGTTATPLALNIERLPHKVIPPVKGSDIQPETFKVKASKGTTVLTASGTEIAVPAEAFVDQEGKTVTGEVEIRYREFNNPLDFFLSGIPTHQVTQGQVFRTESAGMFEILAFQHDKMLELNRDKVLDVSLQSAFPGEMTCFFFNETSGSWENQGSSLLTDFAKETVVANVTEPEAEVDTTALPVLPRKADRKKFVFNVKVDLSAFPELADYQGLLFEVNETYKKFDERLYENTWEKAVLTHSSVPSNYDLTLSIRDSSVTIMVYPVFNNRNYDEALKVYTEKKQNWIAQQKERQKSQATNRGLASRKDALHPGETVPAVAFNALKKLGKRHVKVTRPGIYQCARLMSNSGMKNIRPVIIDENRKEMTGVMTYITQRDHNTLSAFGDSPVISFDSGAENLFWVVTKEGKIGMLTPGTFATLTGNQTEPVLRLKFVAPEEGIAMLKKEMKI